MLEIVQQQIDRMQMVDAHTYEYHESEDEGDIDMTDIEGELEVHLATGFD